MKKRVCIRCGGSGKEKKYSRYGTSVKRGTCTQCNGHGHVWVKPKKERKP